MSYVPLKEAEIYVRRRDEFDGSNIHARWLTNCENEVLTNHRYVVYSYGLHFPMYIYDSATNKWYGNIDKYSPTTSRHQSACRPPNVHEWYDTGRMRMFAEKGVVPMLRKRVLSGQVA